MVRLALILFLPLLLMGAQKVEIRANSFYADEKKGENILSGNVFVKRGEDILQAAKLVVFTDKKRRAKLYHATGDARFEIALKDKFYKGRGDELIYDATKDSYEISGNAFVEELTSKQRLTGKKIIIDKRQESYSVVSDEKKPVKFVFELDEK